MAGHSKRIEARGIACDVAEVTFLPLLTVPVTDEATARAVSRLVEALEAHENVNEVYSNAEMPGAD
jgi:transcriptional/translational regulatory protein YebC/TACO1